MGSSVPDRVNKHWGSKQIVVSWSRVIHKGMICVWKQTDGPCMFPLTLVQIRSQIKEATWLLQSESSSDQVYFLLSASPTFESFPVLSLLPTLKSPPFVFAPFFFSTCPTLIFPFFVDRSVAIPFFWPCLIFPISLSHFHHMSGKEVCVVSAQLWKNSRKVSFGLLVSSDFWAVRGPQLGNDHFSGSN